MLADGRIDRRRILLTGFTGFPRQPFNVTGLYVDALARMVATHFPDLHVTTAVLPTEWYRGPQAQLDLLERWRPRVVLHFGVAGRAKGFEIETRGQNLCVDEDDACGSGPSGRHIEIGGAAYHRVDLPAAAAVARLRRRRIPARVSRDAGRYICNLVLYRGLALTKSTEIQLGFVHLPAELSPNDHRRNGVQWTSPLTWSEALVGGTEILGACLGRPVPAHMKFGDAQRIRTHASRQGARQLGL
jgi:pyroglutamyl-peptidase